MAYLVLGVALVVGVILVSRWYVSAPPSTIVTVFKWLAGLLALVLAAIVILTKNLIWVLPALFILVPRFLRARRASKNWNRMSQASGSGGGSGGGTGANTGNSSQVETKFLNMYLDHDSGEMNGDILEGQFNGQTLRSLKLDQLLTLLGECMDDEQSVQVLTAYLDRYHPDEWRERAGTAHSGTSAGKSTGDMSTEEACEILGLKPNASDDDIKEAHHRLINKNHPDKGGSTYLAAKINQAKEYLLGQ